MAVHYCLASAPPTSLSALRPEEEPWAALTPRDVARLLSELSIRWWIAGGWALDTEGRRPHKDVDVAVLRPDHELLREQLADWDLWIAYRGTLRPWVSGPVGPPENAVWARPTPADPWHIDFKIETVEGDEWVYRRDSAVRRRVAELGITVDGIPYLAHDLAQLYATRELT
jgi:hypothetical protein